MTYHVSSEASLFAGATGSAGSAGRPVRVVVVGGLDPSGGAGIARDLLTLTAFAAQAALVGTAWTEQGPCSDGTIEARPSERVRAALTAALARGGDAVKIGMVANAAIAKELFQTLSGYSGPVVYDPVLRATSGEALYQGDREAVLALARRVSLVTPNLAEAGWLLDRPVDRPVENESDARAAARALRGLGIPAVLVKGGHLCGDATDILLGPEGETVFSSPRIPGKSPRGTGCALATAIAVQLARGETLERAVAAAKTWLSRRIASAHSVSNERHLGSG